jgi:microcystin-dependent protein
MSSVFIGQIIQGGWNFAPRGFAMCAGQVMSISQYSALFSLLGTAFGGNGTSTFQLPDLQGRTMIGTGNGAGLSPYTLGQKAGGESVILTQNQLPAHSHPATFASTSTFEASQADGTSRGPKSPPSMLARATDGATPSTALPHIYVPAGTAPTVPLGGLNVAGTVTVGATGSNVPVSVVQPYLGITMVIATEGLFPSRN